MTPRAQHLRYGASSSSTSTTRNARPCFLPVSECSSRRHAFPHQPTATGVTTPTAYRPMASLASLTQPTQVTVAWQYSLWLLFPERLAVLLPSYLSTVFQLRIASMYVCTSGGRSKSERERELWETMLSPCYYERVANTYVQLACVGLAGLASAGVPPTATYAAAVVSRFMMAQKMKDDEKVAVGRRKKERKQGSFLMLRTMMTIAVVGWLAGVVQRRWSEAKERMEVEERRRSSVRARTHAHTCTLAATTAAGHSPDSSE